MNFSTVIYFQSVGLSIGIDKGSGKILTGHSCHQIILHGKSHTKPFILTPQKTSRIAGDYIRPVLEATSEGNRGSSSAGLLEYSVVESVLSLDTLYPVGYVCWIVSIHFSQGPCKKNRP